MSVSLIVLEASLKQIKALGDDFCTSFYQLLFTKHPELKLLLGSIPTEELHKQLMLSLDLIVYNIRRPHVLDYLLKEMGMRYLRHGATAQHYEQIAEVLMQTFSQYLDKYWLVEAQQSWSEAYRMVVVKMTYDYAQQSPRQPTTSQIEERQPQIYEREILPPDQQPESNTGLVPQSTPPPRQQKPEPLAKQTIIQSNEDQNQQKLPKKTLLKIIGETLNRQFENDFLVVVVVFSIVAVVLLIIFYLY